MKGLLKEFLKSIFMDVVMALVLSGVISLIRFVFHGNVTRTQFLGGALAIFLLLLLDYIYNWIRTLILMKKDPVFKQMTIQTGISWKDYKKIKNG